MNEKQLEEMFKSIGKKAGNKAAKAVFKKIILPFLPVICIILVIFMGLLMLVGAVYSAFPDTKNSGREVGILAGVNQSQRDIEMYREYENLCYRYNIEDTWVVNKRPAYPGGEKHESSPESPYYPGGGVERTFEFSDTYKNDYKLSLLWSQVHAATLYRAYTLKEAEIKDDIMENVTKDLHPYYYYKMSEVITRGEDGYKIDIVYLLVEAYTIQGHYQYHYKWVTRTFDDGFKITREELAETKQILPEKHQRLEDWMKKEYKIDANKEGMATARTALLQASSGYYNKKEWIDWLTRVNGASWVSGAMVPADLMSCFVEAGKKYNIPWWFLAAVALKESTFDPQAENPDSKCYGLMQVQPSNWAAYAPILGFDVNMDKDNPMAQVMVGAYLLYEQGLKNVNFDSPDWEEQTLPVLTFYGGFRGSDAEERCKKEYSSTIWKYCEQFKNVKATWPVPGYTVIRSGYGMREHPIYGYEKLHEGIDIGAPTGASVVSVSGGIAYPDYDPGGYGNMITVKDGTYEYLFAHLSEINVVSGQTVTSGQEIGKVGSTGSSTGPHLHFGVYLLGSGQPIDPLLIISPN